MGPRAGADDWGVSTRSNAACSGGIAHLGVRGGPGDRAGKVKTLPDLRDFQPVATPAAPMGESTPQQADCGVRVMNPSCPLVGHVPV